MHPLLLIWLACTSADTGTVADDTGGTTDTQDTVDTDTPPTDTAPPPAPEGWNLLSNPGFETGDTTGWTTGGTVTDDPHSGIHSLQLSGTAGETRAVTQAIGPFAEAGRPYVVSAWVKLGTPDALALRLTVQEHGQGRHESTFEAVPAGEWTLLEFPVELIEAAGLVDFSIEASDAFELSLDDLAVTDTSATFVPTDDPQLQLIGRWDRTDPAAPTCGWQGSAVQATFQGTGVGVIYDTGDRSESLRAVLDDDRLGSTKREHRSGTQLHVLAEHLPDGDHRLEWVKETNYGSSATLHGLVVYGTGLTAPPTRPSRRIEFYGDSNLAGYSLESEENRGGVDKDGHYFGYAGLMGRMFDAEVQNISWSGSRISQVHDRFTRVAYDRADDTWDFGDHPADLVVVNLDSLPDDHRATVSAVRQVIVDNLPAGLEEGIQYGMIGYYVPHSVCPDGYHCDPKQPVPYAGLNDKIKKKRTSVRNL